MNELPILFLIFNHSHTPAQEQTARAELGIGGIQLLPDNLRNLWAQIPADLPTLDGYLTPLKVWLAATARQGDFVLIQGDFGATYLMVRFSLERGLIPVYATTRREATEERGEDGAVMIIHRFRHVRYRNYETIPKG
jgi:hypothetical protein